MAHLSTRAAAHADIVYPAAIPFLLVHVSCLAAFWSGVTWRALALCAVVYWVRIFAVGAGYHRCFSHRAFATSRGFQVVLAFLAQTSAQSSVLWWASKHRRHHLHSDTPKDTHSAQHRGLLYSHVGWIFDSPNVPADLTAVADLTRYPELMLLHRLELAPAVIVGVASYFFAGWSGVVVGFLWSTVLVWHATFCINSLAHLSGRRRYLTGDQSRNNWLLAIFTMGEGWHNNHHAHQSSVRQGFRWWEYDATFYLLWLAERVGLVWDLKRPPVPVLRNEHRVGARVLVLSVIGQLVSGSRPVGGLGQERAMEPIDFRRHRFPAEVIRYAVWLYFRFALSFRDVEELLAQRGIEVSYETIRCWTLKFGRLFARNLRRLQPRPTGRWHLDEMMIKIGGKKRWLWRAVDDEGVVLDMLVQSRRDKKAALRLLRKLMKNTGVAPETVTTDKLTSYGAALRKLGLGERQRCRGLACPHGVIRVQR